MSFLSLFEHCDSRGKTIVSLLFAAINQTKKKTATSIMLRLSVLLFGYDDNRKRIQKERTQYAKMPVSSSLIFVSLFQFKCSSYIFCVRVCAMLPFYLSLASLVTSRETQNTHWTNGDSAILLFVSKRLRTWRAFKSAVREIFVAARSVWSILLRMSCWQ